jgi:hypothetical protein
VGDSLDAPHLLRRSPLPFPGPGLDCGGSGDDDDDDEGNGVGVPFLPFVGSSDPVEEAADPSREPSLLASPSSPSSAALASSA